MRQRNATQVLRKTARTTQTAAHMSLALSKQQKSLSNQYCIVNCLNAVGTHKPVIFASVLTASRQHEGHVLFMVCSCDRFVCQLVYFAYAASSMVSMWLVSCTAQPSTNSLHAVPYYNVTYVTAQNAGNQTMKKCWHVSGKHAAYWERFGT